MARFPLIVVIGFFEAHLMITTSVFATNLLVYQDHDQALHGHAYRNISAATMENCLQHCLANCSCLSFQICRQNKCQLCSSSKHLKPKALRETNGCSSYNFGSQKESEVSNQQCDNSCTTGVNCCLTSNPCQNGGTCQPLSPNSENRFRCKCPDGYEGERCERTPCIPGYQGRHCDKPIKSCRGYSNGNRVPGKYTVLADTVTGDSFEVFCDFDENSTMAWTLVQSYQLRNKDMVKASFSVNNPRNQNNPSWADYRLSKSRMTSIQQDSQKWRFTCQYDTDGLSYKDYVRGSSDDVDIFTFDAIRCVKVEYINIRGYECSSCTFLMAQQQRRHIPLHFDSYHSKKQGCHELSTDAHACHQTAAAGYNGEDNFGFYSCQNKQHRCSSSNDSTTQTWLGA